MNDDTWLAALDSPLQMQGIHLLAMRQRGHSRRNAKLQVLRIEFVTSLLDSDALRCSILVAQAVATSRALPHQAPSRVLEK